MYRLVNAFTRCLADKLSPEKIGRLFPVGAPSSLWRKSRIRPGPGVMEPVY